MQETRSRLARWTSLIALIAIVAAACTNPAASSTAPTQAPPASSAPTDAPASVAPTDAPAEAFKIGYISLGDSVPFVKLVSDGIREAAKAAGQTTFRIVGVEPRMWYVTGADGVTIDVTAQSVIVRVPLVNADLEFTPGSY